MPRWRVTIAAVAAAALGAAAQEPPKFRSGVDVVTVTATVTRDGRWVSGLTRNDFTVLEDGSPREILYFEDETAPVSLGILLDASGSMAGNITGSKLALAREVISRFVSHDLDGASEWFFARFSGAVVRTQEWTTDRAAIVQALREVRATGDTALRDAIALTIPLVEEGHMYKKALLVVSDGGETRSLVSQDEVQKAIGTSDVRVYGVGINADMRTLRRVGDDTGGRTEAVNSAADVQAATARIADELRHQYLLSYSTSAPKDGRRHAIRVEVRGRGLKVRARQGFVAD